MFKSGALVFEFARFMENTDLPGDDYNITHHPEGTPASVCQVNILLI